MNYNEAEKKLKKYGQDHVLKYYDQINDDEKKALLDQIGSADFSVIESSIEAMEAPAKEHKISPIEALKLPEIGDSMDKYKNIGLDAIKAGKVGAVLLAGGMGTRLGAEGPKGVFNIGKTREVYIFQRIIENMLDVVKEAGCFIHLFVMTSDKNDEETRNFFEAHQYFGYDKGFVSFFKQDMALATDVNGKVYMSSKYHIADSPNGNGGWFLSLKKSGLLDVIHNEGIEWLNCFAVDNVLQRIADPVFIGAVIDHGDKCGSKVVRKADPDEKVGVMCLKDGHPSVIEYYEMTPKLRDTRTSDGEYAYNFGVILNYLFDVQSLEEIASSRLPWHVVNKKIPYLDENGDLISPEEPNGYKYETLILDMVEMFDSCLPFEVVREKEFAPVKNKTGVDSVESAQKLLEENGYTL
ncbi:MAG: UDPGP type 1 family protein [Lachnospiraceae bacterium]|jgi:UDP-N-acetylglucosamine/UDP-N-acetylgalactosamine diphosphorylase|nr:UDPGP type 1 family protein [Lachnospiraceae bacterium]